jgi:hypothetical protein
MTSCSWTTTTYNGATTSIAQSKTISLDKLVSLHIVEILTHSLHRPGSLSQNVLNNIKSTRFWF